MDTEADIPLPVKFNPLKHHRDYILNFLKTTSPDMIISRMDPICNGYTDIYTGSMDPVSIGNSVISILKSNRVLQVDDFSRWLGLKNGYRQIKLEDHSEWIVRKGAENECYIHLHPARAGPFTIRFKGSTLKTIYLLKTCFTDFEEKLSLENVNRARTQIGLSPVKRLEKSKGILNCYRIFFDQEFHF